MAVHIEREDIDGVTVLRLSGTSTRGPVGEDVREAIRASLQTEPCSKLVVNLLDLTETSAIGMFPIISWCLRRQSGSNGLDASIQPWVASAVYVGL